MLIFFEFVVIRSLSTVYSGLASWWIIDLGSIYAINSSCCAVILLSLPFRAVAQALVVLLLLYSLLSLADAVS